jgi:hypothetical protein
VILARIAALLVILSQAILIWVCLEPSGTSAIFFTFVGHPLVAAGYVLALIALTRRLRRQRAARAAAEAAREVR